MINKQQHDNTPVAKRYMKEIFENNQVLDITISEAGDVDDTYLNMSGCSEH